MKLESAADLKNFFLNKFECLKVLVFLSDAIEASRLYEQAVNDCLEDFEEADMHILLIKDGAPGCESAFAEYKVDSVPCALVLNANLSVLERLQNLPPGELLLRHNKLSKLFYQNMELEKTRYKQTLNRVLANNIFILFEFLKPMIPEYDPCRAFLEASNVSFRRQSTMPFNEQNLLTIIGHLGLYLKDSPTAFMDHAPVVYFNKRLVFSLEELKDLFKTFESLIVMLKETESNNLDKLLSNNKVVLFINEEASDYKGVHLPILKGLQAKKVMFSYLDIASKPAIGQLLSAKSGKKGLELPMLVVEGARFYDRQDLEKALSERFDGIIDKKYIIESVDDRISVLLESQPVMLFIKGTPEFPQCGFTRQILDLVVGKGVRFGYYNILCDEELRERLKEYSNWKTYPQVYVNKELIGGLDIIREMIDIGQFDDVFAAYVEK